GSSNSFYKVHSNETWSVRLAFITRKVAPSIGKDTDTCAMFDVSQQQCGFTPKRRFSLKLSSTTEHAAECLERRELLEDDARPGQAHRVITPEMIWK
ncbi:hypothetical protein TNCV_2664281, partial [Trichonephila clavipes]